jgi:3-hydroxyacyl-[acyl-carrier-protein] dehydratase
MRFSLVDRITELQPGQSITALKNLSSAEEYLADHFPGFPVMPGVLMLETLVQTGAWLMRRTEDFRYSTVLLKESRAVKFNSFVTPGRTLLVTATVQKNTAGEYTFKAEGRTLQAGSNQPGGVTVSAKLVLEQLNLADRNADLAEIDRRNIEEARRTFARIYQPIGADGRAAA